MVATGLVFNLIKAHYLALNLNCIIDFYVHSRGMSKLDLKKNLMKIFTDSKTCILNIGDIGFLACGHNNFSDLEP